MERNQVDDDSSKKKRKKRVVSVARETAGRDIYYERSNPMNPSDRYAKRNGIVRMQTRRRSFRKLKKQNVKNFINYVYFAVVERNCNAQSISLCFKIFPWSGANGRGSARVHQFMTTDRNKNWNVPFQQSLETPLSLFIRRLPG